MRRCRSRRARAGLAAGALLVGLVGAAPAGAAEPPVPAAEAAPAAEAPAPAAPAPPPGMQARVTVTDIAGDEVTRHSFAYYKLGNQVRMEPDESGDPRFTPETLYDYDERFSYRNLSDDAITFAYRISLQERVLAQVEGFMTTPPEEPVYRLEVNPKVTFDGHPCTLVLAGFPSLDGRIHALHWVWEAQDLDGLPVKVVFPRGDGSIEIVEYRQATAAPFDPALVSVPEGRPIMTGL